jgi:uncharacterized membrane protein YkvA (DUF1232 family)
MKCRSGTPPIGSLYRRLIQSKHGNRVATCARRCGHFGYQTGVYDSGISFSGAGQSALVECVAKPKRHNAGRKQTRSKTGRSTKRGAQAPAAQRTRRRPAHEKAAIRSDAFAKAILDAKSYTADPETLRTLFREASVKAAAIPKTALNDLGPYLQAMLRLLRAYAGGEYRKIAKDALLTIIASISYLVDPFDLIPDEIPFLGFVDDATVIGFAVSRTRESLDEFMLWETRAD